MTTDSNGEDDSSTSRPPKAEVDATQNHLDTPRFSDEESTIYSSSNQPDGRDGKKSQEKSLYTSVVSTVGEVSVKLSTLINDNLIAARYGAIATIGMLAIYGIAHTPLFFRYRTIADIPTSYFSGRKSIVGRLIRTVPATDQDQAIVCHIRHLSPAERFLSKSAFEWIMKYHPSSAILGKRPDQSDRELLQVEIAGVRSPPWYRSLSEQPGEWLSRLADERTMVTCQLLARQVPESVESKSETPRSKRAMQSVLPELQDDNASLLSATDQVAICKVYHRSQLQLFATDLAESMVRFGRVSVATDGLYAPHPNARILDTTTSVKDLQKDAAYMERLSRAEYEAAKGSYGMWADENIRKEREDVIQEVDFQTSAKFYQKLWRWIRGG